MIHSNLLADVISLSQDTGRYILSELDGVAPSDIEIKEYNSLVSYVDKTAEKRIVKTLKQLLPEAGFVTEEGEADPSIGQDYHWIVDPLDGTTNFLMGIPHFSVSIALEGPDGYLLGVVVEANSNETFAATKGGGATRNGIPIHVSQAKFSDILVATGFPYTNDYAVADYLNVIHSILMETRGLRRMGSAALDLAYVACGRYGVYYESHLNPWDIAAGALIVSEAGGIVSDYTNGNMYKSGSEVLACAPQYHQKMIDLLSPLSQ